jgi:hypothetical protein
MADTVKLKYSCYYTHEVTALPGKPKGKSYSHPRLGSAPDKMTIEVHVEPKDQWLAQVEASAAIRLGSAGLCYVSRGRWRLDPDAPDGHGCKGQPLVRRRDIAHGHSASWVWPFGTRVDVVEAPDDFPMNTPLYVADRFGRSAKAASQPHRIDCMTGDPDQQLAWIKARVTKPWRGPDRQTSTWQRFAALFRRPDSAVSRRPVLGAQQCLNALGYVGKNGKPLDEDNGWGEQTEHALTEWSNGLPERLRCHRIQPADAEVYWRVRDDAKAKMVG